MVEVKVRTRTPRGHIIVSVLALLWSIAGIGAFISQETMSAETIAALPPIERELWQNQPLWSVIAYAVAVFAQGIGAIGLLLRRRWAVPLFALTIAAVLIQFSYPILIAGALTFAEPWRLIFPAIIVLIAVALFLYARWAAKADLLR